MRTTQPTYDPNAYAAIAVYQAGSDTAQLLSTEDGKVVLFDNLGVARDVAPLLARDKITLWNGDRETLRFLEPGGAVCQRGVSRLDILTGYDVYDLPPNHPVRSEAKGRDWKQHVIWTEWLEQESRA